MPTQGLEQLNTTRMSVARDGLTERNLDFSSPFRCTKKADTHLGICFFAFIEDGTRTFKCKAPVEPCLPPVSTAATPYDSSEGRIGNESLPVYDKRSLAIRSPGLPPGGSNNPSVSFLYTRLRDCCRIASYGRFVRSRVFYVLQYPYRTISTAC